MVGLLVLAAVAAIAYAVGTSGDESRAETTAPASASDTAPDESPDQVANAAYLDAVDPVIAKLGRSAAIVGRVLTETAVPADLERLRQVAQQQQPPVQQARTQLARLSPPPRLGTAHRKLVTATAAHRRLLALIARATRSNAADVDATLRRVASAARATLGDYRSFFAASGLVNTVRGVGLADTSGLSDALRERERREVNPEPSPDDEFPPPAPPPGVPRTYEGAFGSVDGLQRCYATDVSVECSSAVSRQRVRLTADAGAEYLGLLGADSESGPRMPIGTSFRTPSGTIQCDSGRFGIRCLLEASAFYIGDRYVRIIFADAEKRFDA